ncbi:hypothetical protein [Desulfatitalea alkaliphila]|uniref:B12-binding domain-containing protein n=1 Tax=Desulfatitalea alkaliphila TaxID=2929485 RepID=A0AA41RBW6_9BACT|nr:hypothetical protein [Desulfatitalea alkaliphila]MCJ8502298.1 hypothetical protein [Desulfatitalea alkaliphila]
MATEDHAPALRQGLAALCRRLQTQGPASGEQMMAAAEELLQLRQRMGGKGLWRRPPRLLTATLDDAIGQGLALIERFAAAIGMVVTPLGLRRPPDAIVHACHDYRPAFLGLTVLWLDSEADLALVARQLPSETRLIAGGPAFRYDPDLATRCGVHHVAADAAGFMAFMLAHSEGEADGHVGSGV